MFSFKGKNTKMVMCFLAFLFFGFILFNLLGKNMEGFGPTPPRFGFPGFRHTPPPRPTPPRFKPTTPGFTTPGFTTPGFTTPGSRPPGFGSPGFGPPGTNCYDNGVVRDRNRKIIECNDRNPRPNTGIINSCNPFNIRDKYICKDTGRVSSQNNMPPSRVQWTKA